MAYVDRIWFYSTTEPGKMTVYIHLRPAGEVRLQVPIPPAFFECIMNMAQHAADLHEEKMRAEILATTGEK